ncbi:MAG: hypothetical protein NTY57_02015 [Solirubrobacterales bacterium]|nr:hypothetical protein [Solirubrobacterales bacterium]
MEILFVIAVLEDVVSKSVANRYQHPRAALIAVGATLLCVGSLASVAAARPAHAAGSLATSAIPAKDVRARGKIATHAWPVKVGRTTYRCGQSGTRWYPGNNVSGIRRSAGKGRFWFATYLAQIRAYQTVRPQTGRTRGAVKNLQRAFPRAAVARCARMNGARVSNKKLTLKTVRLVGKKGLVARQTGPVRRRAGSPKARAAADDGTDLLQVINTDSSLSNAVVSGTGSIYQIFHAPNGSIVNVFDPPAPIAGAPEPDASNPGCVVGKLDPATGVTACLLDSNKITGWNRYAQGFQGYYESPLVRFDESSAIYIVGADGPDPSKAPLYRIDPAGTVTDLLADHVAGTLWGGGATVLPSGVVVASLREDRRAYLERISPSLERATLCVLPDLPLGDPMENMCYYSLAGFTANGRALLMGQLPANRLSADHLQLESPEPTAWVWSNLPPAVYSLGPDDQLFPREPLLASWDHGIYSDMEPKTTWAEADCLLSCTVGPLSSPALLSDNSSIGIMGENGGATGADHGYTSSLMELAPQARKLNLPDVTQPLVGRQLTGTDKYAVAGISKSTTTCFFDRPLWSQAEQDAYPCDADEQLAIYDKSANNDTPVTLPYRIAIYDMHSSGDGKTLYIAAKRASDGAWLVGTVNITTATLSIISESNNPPNSLGTF